MQHIFALATTMGHCDSQTIMTSRKSPQTKQQTDQREIIKLFSNMNYVRIAPLRLTALNRVSLTTIIFNQKKKQTKSDMW
jgi:hypothetical protein